MTLHDSFMTDPAKLTTSFSLLKKRKKRKDLDKLLTGRHYHHIRTSSCQDFNKTNSINDCNDAISSTDDTTTLLNSTDEGLEYLTNSLNRQKSKFLCCNYNSFIVFSCLINIITIIGFVFLAVLLFINKNNLEEWKNDKYHDISQMKLQIVHLQSQFSSSKLINNIGHINQTISNHTLRLQLLEQKASELSKILISHDYGTKNNKKPSELAKSINELHNNDTKILELVNFNAGKILEVESLCYKFLNSSRMEWIKNITSFIPQINTVLFHPNINQINSFQNESTAVLLTLSEYKTFLNFLSKHKP